MDKMLLTPTDCAQLLSLGRSKVYELLASGQLPSVQVGRARRVPAAALEAFIARLGDTNADGPPSPW